MGDITGLQSSVKEFGNRSNRAEAIAGGTRRSAIEIPVYGSGEVTQQVWFPHYYTEKPLHYFGVEVVGNQNIPVGKAPLTSAIVRSWNTKVTADGLIMYTGARVICIAAGNSALSSSIKYSFKVTFEGKAIVVPIAQ